MKKQILSLTTLLIAAGISTAYPVAAADDLGPKSSVAQLTVDPGNIVLQQVPDLNFGGISVYEIVSGQFTKHALRSNKVNQGPVKNSTNANDGNASGLLQVGDYRGTSAGWTLTAKMDALTDGKGHFLEGYIDLVGTNPTTSNPDLNAVHPAGAQAPRLKFAKDQQTPETVVWQADAASATSTGQGQGNNQVTIGAGTELTLVSSPTNVTTQVGRYQAAITWTLANAPQP